MDKLTLTPDDRLGGTMSAGTMKTIDANGIRFAYREEGTGPLVLLLHGFPDTSETWADVMPKLAAAGWRAVAPNLRGYPPTSAPADGDYSVLRLGEDVLALIEALGAERAVVVDEEFRHDEERDASGTGRCVGQARQHQMDDIVREIVLAIGDEDLLASTRWTMLSVQSCSP
ncbi:MAG: alpha/beta fold hydrolase [Myxococcales bacterium]|nr:alpha/beta fold hydrolase [Myxococcales bacterium]